MKKILLLTTTVLIMILYACGSRNDKDNSEYNDSVPTMPYNMPIDSLDQDSMNMMDGIDSIDYSDSI